MAQQLIKVPPTKNTLLRLKKQVKFLEEGHDLLERKRELLTRLVYERIGAYRRLRSDAEKALAESFRCLSITGLDHRLVHLAGRSKASRRKALIGQPRSQLSLRLH
jgi:V/A-type H+-transporting ATPase subunit D